MNKQQMTGNLVWEYFSITLGGRVFKGALPVAQKLGEKVIKKYAAKLRPYLNKMLGILEDSIDNYSRALTSICEGDTSVQVSYEQQIPPKMKKSCDNDFL